MQGRWKLVGLLVSVMAMLCFSSTVFAAKEMFTANLKISEVKLAGGAYPVEGEKPNYSWAVHTFDEKKYSMKNFYWRYTSTYQEMTSDETFESGRSYELVATFDPVGEYYFDDIQNITAGFYNFEEGYTTTIRTTSTGIQVIYKFLMPYNVTFDTDGGTQIPPQKVSHGQVAIKPSNPKKTGYVFKGWYKDRMHANFVNIDRNPIYQDTTYYAFFVNEDTPYAAKLYDLDLGTYEVGYKKIEKTGFKIENTGSRPFEYTTIELSGNDIEHVGMLRVASKVLSYGNSSDTLQQVIVTEGMQPGTYLYAAKLLVCDTLDGTYQEVDTAILKITIVEPNKPSALSAKVEDIDMGVIEEGYSNQNHKIEVEVVNTGTDEITSHKFDYESDFFSIIGTGLKHTVLLRNNLKAGKYEGTATLKIKGNGDIFYEADTFKITLEIKEKEPIETTPTEATPLEQPQVILAEEPTETSDDDSAIIPTNQPIIAPAEQPTQKDWSKASNWAIEELEKASEQNLIPWIFENADLTLEITRREFAYVAVKLYEKITNEKLVEAKDNPFTDTTDIEVLKAYGIGITNGTSDTTFSPDKLITREQMATMMARTLNKAGIDITINLENVSKYADDDKMHEWSREAIYYMSSIEIIKGVGNNQFGVAGNATREQALLMSVRSAKKFEK